MQSTSKTFNLSELIADGERFQMLQTVEEAEIYISLCCSCRSAACTACEKINQIIHSYYTRTVQYLPILGSAAFIQYILRRFRCNNKTCYRKIFSEQRADFIAPYSRRTDRVAQHLAKIAIEMSAAKTSYISRHSKIPISSSTCLRIVKKIPIASTADPEVIGIDDYAKRKGIHYGSVIVNMQTRCTIDMIDSRHPDEVRKHLLFYRKAKFVSRDRSSSYAFNI